MASTYPTTLTLSSSETPNVDEICEATLFRNPAIQKANHSRNRELYGK